MRNSCLPSSQHRVTRTPYAAILNIMLWLLMLSNAAASHENQAAEEWDCQEGHVWDDSKQRCTPHILVLTRHCNNTWLCNQGSRLASSQVTAVTLLAVLHANRLSSAVTESAARLSPDLGMAASFASYCEQPSRLHDDNHVENQYIQACVRRVASNDTNTGYGRYGRRCTAVVGPGARGDSVAGLTYGSLINFHGTPLISPFVTDTLMSSSLPMLARTIPTDQTLVHNLVELCLYFGWRDVGLLHTDDGWADGVVGDFRVRTASSDINVRTVHAYTPGTEETESSLNETLLQLDQEAGQVVVAFVASNQISEFMQAVQSFKHSHLSQVVWVFVQNDFDWMRQDPQETCFENRTGDCEVLNFEADGVLGVYANGLAEAAAAERLTRAYREEMALGTRSEFYQSLPDHVREDLDPEVERYAQRLPSESGFAYDGVMILASALSDPADPPHSAKSAIPSDKCDEGCRFFDKMIAQSVAGSSGPVEFNHQGDRDTSKYLAFGLINIQNGTRVHVADFGVVHDQVLGEGSFEMRRWADIHWSNERVTTGHDDDPEKFDLDTGYVPKDGFNCAMGTYFNQSQDICEPCPQGMYSDETCAPSGICRTAKEDRCKVCPAGYISSQVGATACASCGDTSFSAPNRTVCLKCPDNTLVKIHGAAGVSVCLCEPGYYSKYRNLAGIELECLPCPEGGTCFGDLWDVDLNVRVTRPPLPKRGYWAGDNASFDDFILCRRMSESCDEWTFDPLDYITIQTNHSGEVTTTGRALTAKPRCFPRYKGRQCDECRSDFHDNGKACVECVDVGAEWASWVVYAALPPLTMLGFIYLLVYLQLKYSSLSYSYMTAQVVALLGSRTNLGAGSGAVQQYHVRWFLQQLSLVNFSGEHAYLDCSLRLSFELRWWTVILLPFIHVGAVLLVNVCYATYRDPNMVKKQVVQALKTQNPHELRDVLGFPQKKQRYGVARFHERRDSATASVRDEPEDDTLTISQGDVRSAPQSFSGVLDVSVVEDEEAPKTKSDSEEGRSTSEVLANPTPPRPSTEGVGMGGGIVGEGGEEARARSSGDGMLTSHPLKGDDSDDQDGAPLEATTIQGARRYNPNHNASPLDLEHIVSEELGDAALGVGMTTEGPEAAITPYDEVVMSRSRMWRRAAQARRKRATFRSVSHRMVRYSFVEACPAILILLKASYLPVLSQILKVMVCDSYGDVTYLRHAPSVECYNFEHYRMLLFAVFMFIAFTIGYPVLLLCVLVHADWRQKLAEPGFQKQFSSLYMAYESKYYLFGLLSFVHMAALTIITMVVKEPVRQLVLGMTVLLLRLSAQVYSRPYLTDWRDMHSAGCLAITVAVLMVSQAMRGLNCVGDSESTQAGQENEASCFSAVVMFWVIISLQLFLLFGGLFMDHAATSVKADLDKKKYNFAILNLKGNWSIATWLSQDPEVVEVLADLDKGLHEWFLLSGIPAPINHYLLAQRKDFVPAFFKAFVGQHPHMYQFVTSETMDLPMRQELADVVRAYQQFRMKSKGRDTSFLHGRLLNRTTEPYLINFLLSSGDDVQSRFRRVLESYERYKDASRRNMNLVQRVVSGVQTRLMHDNVNETKNLITLSGSDISEVFKEST